jgi:hypothetical protein
MLYLRLTVNLSRSWLVCSESLVRGAANPWVTGHCHLENGLPAHARIVENGAVAPGTDPGDLALATLAAPQGGCWSAQYLAAYDRVVGER